MYSVIYSDVLQLIFSTLETHVLLLMESIFIKAHFPVISDSKQLQSKTAATTRKF